MKTMKQLIVTAVAGLMLVAGTGAAMAYPGVATGSVHVRSGPGVQYRVLDTLYRGERVDIRQCRAGWCYVVHRGPDGWVSAGYLDRGYRRRPPVHRPPIIIRPPYFPYYYPPFYWNDDGDHHHRHNRNPPPVVTPPRHHTPGDICRIHPDWRMCRNLPGGNTAY